LTLTGNWMWRSGAALSMSLLLSAQAFGWGDEGHKIISIIADRHLTAQARRKVEEIIGPGISLASISNWADTIQRARPETSSWHYIDIPMAASQIDFARDCPKGNCVTAAIARSIGVVRDTLSPPEAKVEALKFLVHFVGDLHQPLHCVDNNDRGGSRLQVAFFGERTNFHRLWDSLLIERIDPNAESYAARLDGGLSQTDIDVWDQGTLDDWALETHALAVKVIYAGLPRGELPELGADYLHTAAPTIDHQLQMTGIRLANILNELFK
jgi:hypothetical protein